MSNINTFVEKIESGLTDPLVSRINTVRKDLQKYYVTALHKASVLERYLGNLLFDHSSIFVTLGCLSCVIHFGFSWRFFLKEWGMLGCVHTER